MKRLVIAAVCLLPLAACGRADPAPRVVDGTTYGTTSVAFRGRWWHHYERGVSWTLGGFNAEAEADFRACLDQRQTDNRLARTYGMHFVQCFAHRELGAVLLATGRLDEAERELRTSLAQEPSAKTEFLLRRIGELRGAKAAAPHAAAPVAEAAPAPDIAARVVLDQVAPRPAVPGGLAISGRFLGLAGLQLWAVAVDGARRLLATDERGAFSADLTAGETIASSPSLDAPASVLVAPQPPPPAPELKLDGPADGRTITGARVWYRFQALANQPLTRLTVSDDDGHELAIEKLDGVQAGGTFALSLEPGRHALRFTLATAAAERSETRTLTMAPAPEQDRRLRAVALVLPLKSPVDGAGVKTGDDPVLLNALHQDGRFRLLDRRADELIGRELELVEAGYVTRTTAARIGKRLDSRYVITGTLRRGFRDIECFARLIHVETGEVVASADAYAGAVTEGQEQAFFAMVAGRLQQVFPVLKGTLAGESSAPILDVGTNAGVVGRMRFFLVHQEPDVVDDKTHEVLLPGARQIVGTFEAAAVDRERTQLTTVGATKATSGTLVSE